MIAEGPCTGRFNLAPDDSGRPQIWVAGGIGVTPFLAWLEALQDAPAQAPDVDLYYCVRSRDDDPFVGRLEALTRTLPSVRLRRGAAAAGRTPRRPPAGRTRVGRRATGDLVLAGRADCSAHSGRTGGGGTDGHPAIRHEALRTCAEAHLPPVQILDRAGVPGWSRSSVASCAAGAHQGSALGDQLLDDQALLGLLQLGNGARSDSMRALSIVSAKSASISAARCASSCAVAASNCNRKGRSAASPARAWSASSPST